MANPAMAKMMANNPMMAKMMAMKGAGKGGFPGMAAFPKGK
jgi:hypothetical protein